MFVEAVVSVDRLTGGQQQLRGLGLVHIAKRCVKTLTTNSPPYDIVLASPKDTAVKLFEKANLLPKNHQLGLLELG